MSESGELDLTSEPWPPERKSQDPLPAHFAPHPPLSSVRVFFNCCRVYAVVRIPDGVLNGQLSSWRFHCPRCGRLNEIPL